MVFKRNMVIVLCLSLCSCKERSGSKSNPNKVGTNSSTNEASSGTVSSIESQEVGILEKHIVFATNETNAENNQEVEPLSHSVPQESETVSQDPLEEHSEPINDSPVTNIPESDDDNTNLIPILSAVGAVVIVGAIGAGIATYKRSKNFNVETRYLEEVSIETPKLKNPRLPPSSPALTPALTSASGFLADPGVKLTTVGDLNLAVAPVSVLAKQDVENLVPNGSQVTIVAATGTSLVPLKNKLNTDPSLQAKIDTIKADGEKPSYQTITVTRPLDVIQPKEGYVDGFPNKKVPTQNNPSEFTKHKSTPNEIASFQSAMAKNNINGDEVINNVIKAQPQFYQLFHCTNKGHLGDTIASHTAKVLDGLITQYKAFDLDKITLPTGVRKEKFKALFLSGGALHDIGKPLGNSKQQHQNTQPLLEHGLRQLGFNDVEVKLASKIFLSDTLGDLAAHSSKTTNIDQKKNMIAKAKLEIDAGANELGITPEAYLRLNLAFYAPDASYYPNLAPNFKTKPSGRQIYDPPNNTSVIDLISQYNPTLLTLWLKRFPAHRYSLGIRQMMGVL